MPKLVLPFAALLFFTANDAPPAHGLAPLQRAPAAGASTLLSSPSAECCKVCRKGKACGNTCIAREKDCHQPPGCACDAE
jgi:hypothetical protein